MPRVKNLYKKDKKKKKELKGKLNKKSPVYKKMKSKIKKGRKG